MRRAQGPSAALLASKYSYLGGFNSTSNMQAGSIYNIPVSSSMSHTFIISFKSLNNLTKTIINGVNITEKALYYKQEA